MPLVHGPWQILGFRLGRFAYLTDCNGVPESSLALLGGLDCSCSTRCGASRTRRISRSTRRWRWRAGSARAQTFFTHIAHDLGHAETCAALPAGMALAYDGLTLMVS